MDGRVGDQLVISGRRVGEAPHRGEVVEVLGEHTFRVRWPDGRETVVVPGTDARIERPAEMAADRGVDELAVTISLRVHETPDRCRVEAMMQTASGMFRGTGTARRHPDDPEVPLIGEELAVARALTELAAELEHAARTALDAHESRPLHLLH